MAILQVKKLSIDRQSFDYASLKQQLQSLEWHIVDYVNWPDSYPYKPGVAFQIGYTADEVVLHFAVEENFVKAQYVRPNEAVFEDSCVEFFISFDQKNTYYNIEFNVLGTGLIGYGPADKTQRNRLKAEQIEQVSTASSVVQVDGKKRWNMVMLIPLATFQLEGKDLAGVKAHANFYKCGDMLPEPHFISWQPIHFPKPNFHKPEFFGEIQFV